MNMKYCHTKGLAEFQTGRKCVLFKGGVTHVNKELEHKRWVHYLIFCSQGAGKALRFMASSVIGPSVC